MRTANTILPLVYGSEPLPQAALERDNLNRTDTECGQKALLSGKLRQTRLRKNRFGIEPEFAAQGSRLGLRRYEIGVTYSGRTYADGKTSSGATGSMPFSLLSSAELKLVLPHAEDAHLEIRRHG